MELGLLSVPLAFIAGVLGIMSPCVWPLVPVMMSSAETAGRRGPLFLALGLSSAFAVAGTILTLALINLNLNPDAFRYVAAWLLMFIGLALLVRPINEWLTLRLSMLTARFNLGSGDTRSKGTAGQFGVGALLGLVWLPCVGPTLGAAIALASMGRDLGMAFLVMFTFGVGTAATLLLAAYLSGKLLQRWRPRLIQGAARGKLTLGGLLVILGLMVLTGVDKILEAWALDILPDWAVSL